MDPMGIGLMVDISIVNGIINQLINPLGLGNFI